MDAVTAAAEPVEEEHEEARRRLSLTMSWSESRKIQESHWKKSAAGRASSHDNQTLGDRAESSSHRRCHGATGPSQCKQVDSPPLKVWGGAVER